jgi:hypothetical protein
MAKGWVPELIEAAHEIRSEPGGYERAFLARELVLATLPHTDPGKVEAWTRQNGDYYLTIQPGWDEVRRRSIGYPYGVIPRLLLFWLTTEALQTQSRRIELGASLAGFMRELGLDPSRGGPRSDSRRLRDQMERLFRSRISFVWHGAGGKGWRNVNVTSEGLLWWDEQVPEQAGLHPSWIILSPEFYEVIRAAPVPVDMRALRALKRSPLALDLYAWLTYRTFAAAKHGKPTRPISWVQLQGQLGTDYSDTKDFRRKVKAALAKIAVVWPALRVEPVRGGFRIHPARPSIPERSPKAVDN